MSARDANARAALWHGDRRHAPEAAANLLLTFCPRGKQWWEYLHQIGGAPQAVKRTSLTVLPALILRAREELTRQNGS